MEGSGRKRGGGFGGGGGGRGVGDMKGGLGGGRDCKGRTSPQWPKDVVIYESVCVTEL